ncbi:MULTISPECIES: RNA polymerase sigma factor [Brucella/Ochrobactrum group]|uniref:RNA polymerase sigma factor n=1 Tax=Brucella pseudintermedia TaxID=370111 RepID=A0ABY5UJY8_9HYPH|nr:MULTISPECIES: RNA polymerase sigma factor [Brucella/Ochrobactrum group]KAB2683372.1 RNA polymerase sigma factor [Brucella pseudintermedia]TWH03499.1 RNA polymerase sigma-70 factor (ECF subfamily) [Ochrobactrum sp. J50]UWL62977.1 RNA polymerase sigma factor [Brucella pseudintermedia]WPM82137.1 RNA polymerase sigma factor [Brucella pseudintermedia]
MPSKSDFEKEVLALLPALRQFARTMCHQSSDVDDLVQETLLKALRHRDRFTPFGSLKSWLFTIMKNTFCTRIKRAQRENTIETWEEPTISAPQELALELQDVGEAYSKLSTAHQKVLDLIIFSGLSYEHAAAETGCTIGTIKSRLNRARARLESNLYTGEKSGSKQ